MKLYKIKGSLGPHNKVQALISRIESEPFAEELQISREAIDTLDDIVSEALDNNMEDPTISDWTVNELVSLIEFLERP